MAVKALVGLVALGNPGEKYRDTRHNLAWLWVEAALEKIEKSFSLKRLQKFDSELIEFETQSKRVQILKPQTFMNLSGKALSKWKKANPRFEKIVALYDDLDTPLGELRLRKKGGAAGHNGALSLFEAWGSQDLPRLKLGIGRPPPGMDGSDFVLKKFRPDEKEKLQELWSLAEKHLLEIVEAPDLDVAMNRINAWRPTRTN